MNKDLKNLLLVYTLVFLGFLALVISMSGCGNSPPPNVVRGPIAAPSVPVQPPTAPTPPQELPGPPEPVLEPIVVPIEAPQTVRAPDCDKEHGHEHH